VSGATDVPDDVLAAYEELDGATFAAFGTGLINRTLLATTAHHRVVVQKLHPIIQPSVNDDLDAVSRHVASKHLVTPRLVRTRSGASAVTLVDGEGDSTTWRVISFVEGVSFDSVASAAHAHEAGALVARFHHAVDDLSYDYRHVRSGVHDVRRHLVKLATALPQHGKHRLATQVAPFARELLDAGALLPNLGALPTRHCHGDLKISNLLFAADGRGLCLVDLDTLQQLSWAFEMGDALRSWCNRDGEDAPHASFDIDLFSASLRGYFGQPSPQLTRVEAVAVVDGIRVICVELAARFLADALHENYFGFDAKRYPARGEHNLARAKGQWSLAQSVKNQRAAMIEIVEALTEQLP
jgi:Ser/Thr protein kinase RdoA (MazF antagonist)